MALPWGKIQDTEPVKGGFMPTQNIVIGLLSGFLLFALAGISDAQQATSVTGAECTAKL